MNDHPPNLPPLEWVRAFEAAARCGSFTAAAAESGLTQSAISQRIAQLEKHLGTPLFHRGPRAITMTLEGEAWLPHVRTALGIVRDSAQALFGVQGRTLTFSASQSMIELWLQPRLEHLLALTRGPISVQSMVLGAHAAPQDDVIRLRYGAGDGAHPYKLRLFSERIAPVAAPALARRGGDWRDWPRIACAGPRPGWTAFARRFAIPTTPLPCLRFDTFNAALGAAKAGHGVLLASLPLSADVLARGDLVQLGDDVLPHHETYWVLAGRDSIPADLWAPLSEVLGPLPGS